MAPIPTTGVLTSGAVQGIDELLSLLIPTNAFGFGALVDCGARSVDRSLSLVVLALGLFERRLGFGGRGVAALAVPGGGGFLLPTRLLAVLFFPLECRRGF